MVTIQELSKKCGVSISTVSKALNGYSDISDKTRELVINTANALGYFPNAGARAVKLKKTYNIGILFNSSPNVSFRNDYFAHVLAAFREEAASHGYDITFIEKQIGRRRMTYLEHCQYRHFDGVCIVHTDSEHDEVLKLINSEIPIVTIDHALPKAHSIISDNFSGMKQLTSFVIRQGHARIAYIYGNKDTSMTRNRLDGYYAALEENKIKVPEEYVVEGMYQNTILAEELTKRLLQLEQRPTCILAPDDVSCMGVLTGIRKTGLVPARDISVAGYDGSDHNLLIGAKLTTVKQDKEHIGKEAAKRLIHIMEQGNASTLDVVAVKPTLIIGNSVRKLA
jgi:LacI family transcriptional regulator